MEESCSHWSKMTLTHSFSFIVNAVSRSQHDQRPSVVCQVTNVVAKQQTQNTGSRLQSPILLWLAKNSPKTHQRSPDSQKWDQLSDTVLTTEQNVIASTIFDHWEQNSPTNWLTQKYYRGHLLVLIKKTPRTYRFELTIRILEDWSVPLNKLQAKLRLKKNVF